MRPHPETVRAQLIGGAHHGERVRVWANAQRYACTQWDDDACGITVSVYRPLKNDQSIFAIVAEQHIDIDDVEMLHPLNPGETAEGEETT